METTRHRLKRMAELLCITQKDIAKKANIREASISHYITGYSEPGQKTIKKIAEAFNVNPSWLMGYGSDDDFRESAALISDSISEFDKTLITAYHDAPKNIQDTINILLDLKE